MSCGSSTGSSTGSSALTDARLMPSGRGFIPGLAEAVFRRTSSVDSRRLRSTSRSTGRSGNQLDTPSLSPVSAALAKTRMRVVMRAPLVNSVAVSRGLRIVRVR